MSLTTNLVIISLGGNRTPRSRITGHGIICKILEGTDSVEPLWPVQNEKMITSQLPAWPRSICACGTVCVWRGVFIEDTVGYGVSLTLGMWESFATG